MSSVDVCWTAANRLRTLSLEVAPGDPNLHDFFGAVAAWLDREGNQTLRAIGTMNGAADPQAIRVAQTFMQCLDPKPDDAVDDQRHRHLLPTALCEWCGHTSATALCPTCKETTP